jgi:hypothetical protein
VLHKLLLLVNCHQRSDLQVLVAACRLYAQVDQKRCKEAIQKRNPNIAMLNFHDGTKVTHINCELFEGQACIAFESHVL